MRFSMLFLISLLLQAKCAVAQQDWVQRDLRGLELAPAPAGQPAPCARLWLEERTWTLQPGNQTMIGVYGNLIRTHPLATSVEECRFSSKPTKPMVFAMRSWNVASTAKQGSAWEMRASPIGATGDQLDTNLESFTTKLWLSTDRLIDSATTAEASERLEFRRPGPPPADLNAAATEILESLYSGGCARTMAGALDAELPAQQSAEMVAAICDLRRRMVALGGPLVSIAIGDVTVIDRAAAAVVRSRNAQGWSNETYYLVEFMTNLEKQQVPADALFTKEGGRWHLVRLWF